MHIINPIWERGYRFTSASYVTNFLQQKYQSLNVLHPLAQAKEKTPAFMYYLEHGRSYYTLSYTAPLEIKPLLLFYGLTHILKAALLTVDPTYPDSTSVLAHGVSTRKKKKKEYLFFQDEIKIQKNGLCTHLAYKLFHVTQLESKKISMGDLMECLPELDSLFTYFRPLKGEVNGVVDKEKLTINEAIDLSELREIYGEGVEVNLQENCTVIYRQTPHVRFPIRYGDTGEITVPRKLTYVQFLPHLLIHYLLLYNLSMIARYETEWWGNLLRTSPTHDYPLIQSFLQSTSTRAPSLLFDYLDVVEGF